MESERNPGAIAPNAITKLARLRGVRAAITGGTSGLGRALVQLLAHHGANVAFLARSQEGLRRTHAEVPRAHAIAADMARKEDIYPAALQITGLLGGLDVLVNNAS